MSIKGFLFVYLVGTIVGIIVASNIELNIKAFMLTSLWAGILGIAFTYSLNWNNWRE